MAHTLKTDLDVAEFLTIQDVVVALEIKTPAGVDYLRFALANARLFDRKQQDYGPTNIAEFGTYGVLVRMSDKFKRLAHLFGKKRKKAVNEPLVDSFRDIHVYANIALMLETGRWK